MGGEFELPKPLLGTPVVTVVRTWSETRPELDMDWIHPGIGLDSIGLDDCNPVLT